MPTGERVDAVSAELSVEKVTKVFQRMDASEPIVALKNIDLPVQQGKFVALIGRSGCGKSTLLRIAAGLATPSAGRVLHAGKEVRGPHYSRGFVFQADAVFPWLTVRQNVEFGLKSRGVGRSDRHHASAYWCEVVGLADFMNAYPKELSGGMRKRVDLARVYANDPDVLLMDEPFGALDAQTKERMQNELLTMWDETRKTVMFVTHDVDEAVFLADEIVVMSARPGEIAARLPITLPRPRNDDTRISDEFADIRRSIRKRMQALDEQAAGKGSRGPRGDSPQQRERRQQ